MGTSKADIKEWFEQALKEGGTHMIVVCDTYDGDDYPVIVLPKESVTEKMKEFDGKNMQRIMEVYDLRLPMEPQLDERRAMHV
jgi:hypothetical protein